MRKKQVIESIGAVGRKHRVAHGATTWLAEAARHDPLVLRDWSVELVDVRRCRQNLEATYLARMFAVVESYLRDVWEIAFGRDTHPRAVDLLNGCASMQSVPDDVLAGAHAVREYRNAVVHGGAADYVSLDDARIHLCTFFGRMPSDW